EDCSPIAGATTVALGSKASVLSAKRSASAASPSLLHAALASSPSFQRSSARDQRVLWSLASCTDIDAEASNKTGTRRRFALGSARRKESSKRVTVSSTSA